MDTNLEGLTGLHYTQELNKSISVDIFFSYLYVPAMGAGIDIKDGKVVSNAEWVRLPPEKTIVLDQEVPIYYTMNRPANSDVVFQKSLGANLEYDWKGGAVSAYGIYKPESTLRSNADATPFLARGVLPVDHLIPHRALRAYAGQAAAAPNDGFEVAPAAAACGFFANKLAGEVTEDNFSEILSNIV